MGEFYQAANWDIFRPLSRIRLPAQIRPESCNIRHAVVNHGNGGRMNKFEIIGIALAAGAAGHFGARGVGRLCRAGGSFLTDCFVGWMDGLDDLAPGRLAHGQPAEMGESETRQTA